MSDKIYAITQDVEVIGAAITFNTTETPVLVYESTNAARYSYKEQVSKDDSATLRYICRIGKHKQLWIFTGQDNNGKDQYKQLKNWKLVRPPAP